MKHFLYISLTAAFVGAVAAPFSPLPATVWADSPEVGPGVGLETSAGPGSVPYTPPKEIGPGIHEEETEEPGIIGDVTGVPNDFLDIVLTDPIVRPVDRYTHEQMVTDIQSLQNRYGDKIQVNVIGWSHDGRAIYEIIIGSMEAPKHVLLQGAIHGREYMTPLLMMSQVELALASYDMGHYNNMALSDMFQQTALHFVPMTNPDGVAISQYGMAAIRSDFVRQEVLASYARDVEAGKTTAPLEEYLPYWKSNGMGVDLNHNFPAHWEEMLLPTVAGSYANYKGTAPLSEPETQALAALSSQRNWAATISYHSMGNIIYWDTDGNQASDSSYALAQAVSQDTGYRLDPSKGKGGFKDFLQTNGQTAPSVTVETGSLACPMPVSEFESVWNQNKSVWAKVMNYVLHR